MMIALVSRTDVFLFCGFRLKVVARERVELLWLNCMNFSERQVVRVSGFRELLYARVVMDERPNDPYSNTYNPRWKNYPNFAWTNNNQVRQPPGFQIPHQPQDKKPSMEVLMTKFITTTEARLNNHEVSMKNVEAQIGQLANAISGRTNGTLPSTSEKNSREQVKAISLRSGKVVEDQEPKEEAHKKSKIPDYEWAEDEKVEAEISKPEKGRDKGTSISYTSNTNLDVNTLPYTDRIRKDKLEAKLSEFRKDKLEAKLSEFLEIIKKLQINILFVEAKFLKDILLGIHQHEVIKENGLESYNQDEKPFCVEEIEELGNNSQLNMVKELDLKEDRTLNETPKIELKPLPDSLKYVFLEKDSNHVIIFSSLTDCEEDMLVKVLKQHKKAIGWSISKDIFKFQLPQKTKKKLLSAAPMCLKNLSLVIQRCEDTNLVQYWEKCHFMVRERIVLGHKIFEHG
ncbi:hypothetical protein H6P81_009954 [Aristolochia fimbriata]|uniref:Reverse transcriptase domain-containing protein n=1 Tax=Aristolochia fimbriata TaxID=158543 RepID=A0AAV7EMX2_ARIFI|nr:hypothetical protein H6P81_009954 [Aristolochia fimbriata]